MKPLDDKSRQLIDQATAAETPPAGAQDALWEILSERFDQPLPPSAEAAQQALAGATSKGLLAGASGVAKLALSGALLVSAAAVWYGLQPRDAPAPRESAPSRSSAPVAGSSADPTEATLSPAVPSPSTLAEETQLVSAAQHALRGGDAREALTLLGRHAARFPSGALAQERDAARVFALCALGRQQDAARARREFVLRWPQSPLTARVRAGCANDRGR